MRTGNAPHSSRPSLFLRSRVGLVDDSRGRRAEQLLRQTISRSAPARGSARRRTAGCEPAGLEYAGRVLSGLVVPGLEDAGLFISGRLVPGHRFRYRRSEGYETRSTAHSREYARGHSGRRRTLCARPLCGTSELVARSRRRSEIFLW